MTTPATTQPAITWESLTTHFNASESRYSRANNLFNGTKNLLMAHAVKSLEVTSDGPAAFATKFAEAFAIAPKSVPVRVSQIRRLVAVLDEAGGLRLFSLDDKRVVLDLDQPVPEWRQGCDGIAIAAADIDGDDVPELVASFAGEPVSFQPLRCRNGGGFEAWKLQLSDSQRHESSPR